MVHQIVLDGDKTALEVDVAPAQANRFRNAASGAQHEGEHREPVLELRRFLDEIQKRLLLGQEYRLGIHQFPSQLIRQQGMDAVLIQQSDHLTGNGKIGIFDSVWKKKNGQALFPFPGMVSKATPHNSRLTA